MPASIAAARTRPWRRLVPLVLALAACGDTGAGGPLAAVADPILPSGTVRLTAVHSGLVLEVADAGRADGDAVQQGDGSGAAHQLWRLAAVAGRADTMVLTAQHSGRALDVANGSRRSGATVAQWQVNGGDNQAWTLRGQDDGSFALVNLHSGLCLDVVGASTAAGAGVTQWRCSGAANQRFRLEGAGAPTPPATGDGGTGAGAATGAGGPPAAATAGKKGGGTWWASGASTALANLGVSWAYDWRSSAAQGNIQPSASLEFVPMIWTAAQVNDADLANVRRDGKVLLGFNEPDQNNPQDGQGPMSVDTALALWPRLEATGMRLGSPAPAHTADVRGAWLDQFMAGAKAQGRRVDFIALHWYPTHIVDAATAVAELEGYVTRVHDMFGLPIWVTEFAMINFGGSPKYPSPEVQVAFAGAAASMLEALPFVERYAWFSLPHYGDSNTNLANDDGSLTAVGRAYRDAH